VAKLRGAARASANPSGEDNDDDDDDDEDEDARLDPKPLKRTSVAETYLGNDEEEVERRRLV